MKAFTRDTVRAVRKSSGRFLAIVGIVALGVGFYAGLRMTCEDMTMAADTYYDGTSLMDVRVMSTLGMTDDDVEVLRNIDGVDGVMPAYELDAIGNIDSEQYVFRIHSLNESALDSDTSDGKNAVSSDNDYLNRPLLEEGRWPEAEGECVISADIVMNSPIEIGDTISLVEGTMELGDTLATDSYTVVGFVHASYYTSSVNLGTSTLGGGSVNQFMYIPESDFSEDTPYTEVFLTVKGAADLENGSDEYKALVAKVTDRIKEIAPEREQIRTEEVKLEIQTAVYDATIEALQEAQAERYAQLSEQVKESAGGSTSTASEEEEAEAEASNSDETSAQEEASYEVEDAEWYVLDRTKNYGLESFRADAERVDSIASVFPLIFFLVAALVALTTMTRMVDEERIVIGTFKALGYSKLRISSKYLIYAASASAIGSIIGVLILPTILPLVILKAYAIMYFVPSMMFPIDVPVALLASSLGIGITLFATLAAAINSLRERPAALLLPPVAKAGKRILLERIKPLWKRLNFTWKVTFRNLFLYKKRFIMTIIGIAGCTALLLTGFALRSAINDMIDLQFSEINKYNVQVIIQSDAEEGTREAVEEFVEDSSTRLYAWSGLKTMMVCPEDANDLSVDIITPENKEDFSQLLTWRDRETGEARELVQKGALVTEKLADTMGIEAGDTIRVYERDETGSPTDTYYDIPVADIVENYTLHYIYLDPELYKAVFDEEVEYTSLIADFTGSDSERDTFIEEGRNLDGVKTVAFNDETVDSYKDMVQCIDMIVWVLIAAAGLLAFIVLYNLININICERVREIATLKVLGFLPKEVSAYIYRETILLSVIGAIVGLGLGVIMASFVVTSAEVDEAMFSHVIHLTSYLLSFGLTLLFTLVVMLVMHRKLHAVNMVESLKSIE